MCNKTKCGQYIYILADVFHDGNVYDVIDIDTPFRKPEDKKRPDERRATSVRKTVHKFMNGDTQTLL